MFIFDMFAKYLNPDYLSPYTSTLLLGTLILVLVLVFWRRGPPLPPGPWGVPILGYLPWISPKSPHLTFTALARRYGRIFSLQMGGVFTVVLSDQRLIRQAFAKDVFSGRAPLYLTHGIMQGYGLICAEGEMWKNQRKFVGACLKNFGMVKFGVKRDKMEQRIDVGVRQVLGKLHVMSADGKPQDILPTLLHSIGNVVNSLVFGRVWEEDNPTWKWLQHLQEEGTKMIGVAGPLNFLPFLRFLPSFRRNIDFLIEGKLKTHKVYEQLIRDYKSADDKNDDNMIGAFLSEMSKKENTDEAEYYSNAQFLHLLADLFGAGVDTTLTTIRWYLLFMAINQGAQKKVQQELDGLLGERLPTLEDAPALPYTEASLAEAQRIRSVTPLGIPHGTLQDTTLDGFHIPAGAMVVPLQWALHMDGDLWADPESFRPERFLGEDGRFTKPDFFIPFQTGNRMCIGEELGRMIMFLFGASIVHRFHISLPDAEAVDVEGECGITLTPKPHAFVLRERF